MTDSSHETQGRDRLVLRHLLKQVSTGSALISLLSILLAGIAGAVLIAVSDDRVAATSAYFFSRPSDFLTALWNAVAGAYGALFSGAVFNPNAQTLSSAFQPLTSSLAFAAPLIAGGLGAAVAFRAGLFNIGGRGQILIAAAASGAVGFIPGVPPVLHLLLAIAAAVAGGALWGAVAGLLKATTGASEVIATIMLNYIAFYLVNWMLRTRGLLQAPDTGDAKSPIVQQTALLPSLVPGTPLTAGILLAILAAIGTWWLLNRSSTGFRFRAVGLNPRAAASAGIAMTRVYVTSMAISGGLLGIAGATQVLGNSVSGFTSGIDAGIGFDAITVALLGRSRPGGVVAAGLLFGALKAGGYSMQAAVGVPVDIVLVVQALIVLFIAAPPLVRSVFRLPRRKDRSQEVYA